MIKTELGWAKLPDDLDEIKYVPMEQIIDEMLDMIGRRKDKE